jgi:glutaconate CoA-transferase subunit B
MLLVEGATYALNPEPSFIPPTGNDLALQAGSAYQLRFEEFFDAAARGDVDRMFLSGGQIDPYGNTNVTAIGGRGRPPKVKLGGGGGGCNLSATIRNLTLWTTRHRSGRTLVQSCDFITDMGHSATSGRRSGIGGGPQWLVTELGVFDFDASGHARLLALFPDVDLETVHTATGFALRTLEEPSTVQPPTREEVELVRRIDPLGVRRAEFAPTELERCFAYAAPTLQGVHSRPNSPRHSEEAAPRFS